MIRLSIFLLALASSCERSVSPPPGVPSAGASVAVSVQPPEASEVLLPPAPVHPTSWGPDDAPVTIVEFSDFQCPFSRKAAITLRDVVTRHAGQVRWLFKSFPLSFHRQAPLLHEAALAAGEWGLFWEMHDKIFASEEALDRRRLVEIAADLGVPRAEFEAVLESRAFLPNVEAEAAEGAALGVTATPTCFVNGFRLEGALSIEAFDYVVSRSLGLSVPAPENAPLAMLLDDPEPSHPFSFGPENAAVVAKVFVDLRSPLGVKAAAIASDVVNLHASKVRFVFKCLPTGIYPDSPTAHEALVALVRHGGNFFDAWRRCARTQGTFHAGSATAMAEELGLGAENAQEVEREVRERTHGGMVEADLSLARRLGIKGSPTLVVQGKRFDGVDGLTEFARALDAGLTQSRNASKADLARDGELAAAGSSCSPAGLAADTGALLLDGRTRADDVTAAYDFGEVASGAAVVHLFELKNDGAVPLKIVASAVPSMLDFREIPREISAGAAEPLEVMFVTGWRRGKVDAAFRLDTNDPFRPSRLFRVSGVVSEEVEVIPPGGLSFRAVAGDAVEVAAELRFAGDAPREVALLGTDVSGLDVRVETLEGGHRFRVRAKLGPDAPIGQRSGTIRLKTSYPRVPEVCLPVDVIVGPEIVATPPLLVAREAGKPLWIRLHSSRNAPFTVKTARSDLIFVRAVPLPGPPASDQRIAVRLVGSKLPQTGARGEILITLEPGEGSHGTLRELQVPIRWEPR